jgi:hypothetical protein
MADIRIQALARLANSRSADAEAALTAEVEAAASVLVTPSSASALSQALEILEVIGFRFPERVVALVSDFLERIEQKPDQIILPSEDDAGLLAGSWYLNHLAGRAIDVALRLRYLRTERVLILLLRESALEREGARQKAKNGLDAIASYEAFVFFGDRENGRPGIGPQPQAEILNVLESLQGAELLRLFDQTRGLAEKILSPTINATRWNSDNVQFSFAAVPATAEVKSVRERAIAFLIRLYEVGPSADKKISVIGALTAATREEDRVPESASIDEMICANAISVLSFFERQASLKISLPVLQALEARAYGVFKRFSNANVVAAAKKVEAAIAKHQEYPIYKTLIGFEGVFEMWSSQTAGSMGFRKNEELRKARASEFVREIGPENYKEWKARILEFAKTDSSDLATFPVFYQFLREVSAHAPALALELISSDARQIDRFLIPLMAGLWNGEHRPDLQALADSWLGKPDLEERYVFALIKMFLSTESVDVELLNRLLERSEAIRDAACLRQLVSVAIARFEADPEGLEALFLRAIDSMSKIGDASWVNEAWYRPEVKPLLARMSDASIDRVLDNLVLLPKLDYHAEEILSAVAERSPLRVLSYLVGRLRHGNRNRSDVTSDRYEPIPYDFHKLDETLSAYPREAVSQTFELFREEPDEFRYGGASLLHGIFSKFPAPFEAELLQLVKERRPGAFDYVFDVLRSYEGEFFLHGLLKEIINEAGGDRDIEGDVMSILLSTGVVHGEFGFVEALDRRRQAIVEWQDDPREAVRRFARDLIPKIERNRDVERARAEESMLLRKRQFGED